MSDPSERSSPFPGSSWSPLPERARRVGLALVVSLALALRLGGVRYGLPYFVHPDESILAPLAAQLLSGDLNPHFFNWPSAYMYVLAGAFAAYHAVVPSGPGGAALDAFVRDPASFYLVGRGVTALLGTLTVALTYLVGIRLFEPTIALAGSFFLAISLQHVVDSHFMTTDVPVTCAILLATAWTLRYWRTGRIGDALAAGVLGGLAASVKYNGGLVGLAFVAAFWDRTRRRPEPWRAAARGATLPAFAGGAVVGFLAGTPFAVLAPGEFARGLFGEVRAIGTVQFGNEGDPPALLFHLLHTLPQAVGLPLLLCAGAGLGLLLLRRRPADWILLAFPLPYLAIIATWDSRFERYAVPLLPFVAILAAFGLATLAERGRGSRALVFWVMVGLVATPAAARVLRYEALLAQPDSREVAGEWIERHLPGGTRVAMEPYSPPTRWGDESLGSDLLSPPAGIAERLPRPRRPADRPTRLRVSRLSPYEVTTLRGRGFDYVVVSSFVYKRYQGSCERFPAPCRFYRDLDETATLVYAIRPLAEDARLWVGDIYAPVSQVFARTRPGPTIKVYRLRGDGGAG